MTPPGRGWNEETLSETPAVEHLRRLGWTYVTPDAIDTERESFKEVVNTRRLAAALKRLNPWISDDNVQKAIRSVTSLQAASLIEAKLEKGDALDTADTFGEREEEAEGGEVIDLMEALRASVERTRASRDGSGGAKKTKKDAGGKPAARKKKSA